VGGSDTGSRLSVGLHIKRVGGRPYMIVFQNTSCDNVGEWGLGWVVGVVEGPLKKSDNGQGLSQRYRVVLHCITHGQSECIVKRDGVNPSGHSKWRNGIKFSLAKVKTRLMLMAVYPTIYHPYQRTPTS
jgi:hypothetical protein